MDPHRLFYFYLLLDNIGFMWIRIFFYSSFFPLNFYRIWQSVFGMAFGLSVCLPVRFFFLKIMTQKKTSGSIIFTFATLSRVCLSKLVSRSVASPMIQHGRHVNLQKTDFNAKFDMVLKQIYQTLMKKVPKISHMSLNISWKVNFLHQFYKN